MNSIGVIQAGLETSQREATIRFLGLLLVALCLLAGVVTLFYFFPREAIKEQRVQVLTGDYILTPSTETRPFYGASTLVGEKEDFRKLSLLADENTVSVHSETTRLAYAFTLSGVPFVYFQDVRVDVFYEAVGESLRLEGNILIRDTRPEWWLYGMAWGICFIAASMLSLFLLSKRGIILYPWTLLRRVPR